MSIPGDVSLFREQRTLLSIDGVPSNGGLLSCVSVRSFFIGDLCGPFSRNVRELPSVSSTVIGKALSGVLKRR